jgi:hypothetical protein
MVYPVRENNSSFDFFCKLNNDTSVRGIRVFGQRFAKLIREKQQIKNQLRRAQTLSLVSQAKSGCKAASLDLPKDLSEARLAQW